VFVLYLAIQIVAQGVLGPSLAANPDTPLAATANHMLRGAGLLLIAGVSISIFGTLSGDLLASPRAIFAAAENGHLPAFLAAVHPRYRTPHVAIVVFAALTCGIAISGAFTFLAVASSAVYLLLSHVTVAAAGVLGSILVAGALYYIIRRKSMTASNTTQGAN
jgi:amino acid transporter